MIIFLELVVVSPPEILWDTGFTTEMNELELIKNLWNSEHIILKIKKVRASWRIFGTSILMELDWRYPFKGASPSAIDSWTKKYVFVPKSKKYYDSNFFVFQSYEYRFAGKFCLFLNHPFPGSFVIGASQGVPIGLYQVSDFGPKSKLWQCFFF